MLGFKIWSLKRFLFRIEILTVLIPPAKRKYFLEIISK